MPRPIGLKYAPDRVLAANIYEHLQKSDSVYAAACSHWRKAYLNPIFKIRVVKRDEPFSGL